jgi:uncharacterized protein involved in exopolysaccharide biosynthesis
MAKRSEKSRILYDLFYVIFRRKGTLISICVISFFLILFLTYLKTPTYKATAKILVRLHPQQQLILFRDLATPSYRVTGANETYNLIQILTSQEMAREVVEKFALDERLRKKREHPENQGDIIKRAIFKAVTDTIGILQDLLQIEKQPHTPNFYAMAVEELIKDAQDIKLEGETNVINLSIWEETPKLSSDIANYMAHRLIEKSTQLEQTNAREAYNFTKEQLKDAERALEDSANALLKYKIKNKIVSVVKQKQSKLDQLHLVESRFISVSNNLSVLQAKLNELKRKIHSKSRLSSNSPIFINNPTRMELINSIESVEIEKRTLKEQMDSLKAEAISLSVMETQLEELTRRKITNEMIYQNLSVKFSELGVQQVSQMSGYDLKIIDKAYVPEDADPDSQNWKVVIVIGYIISIILGFGAVFFVEYWDESFKSAHQIEEQLALPVLCTLPQIRLGWLRRWKG